MNFDQLYIGGQWADPTGDAIQVTSPHDGSLVGTAAGASVGDVDRAVAAARRAFDAGPWPQHVRG